MGHGKWGRQGLEVTWGECLHALGPVFSSKEKSAEAAANRV